jgi:surfactin synthase thioesterase subunit
MMNVRKGLQTKAKKVAFGVGMGALLSFPVATMVTSTAGATTPAACYPGCSAPSTGLPTTSGSGAASSITTPASAASSTGSLAFTGADLSELVIISVGALGAGTVLVRYSRRRQAA